MDKQWCKDTVPLCHKNSTVKVCTREEQSQHKKQTADGGLFCLTNGRGWGRVQARLLILKKVRYRPEKAGYMDIIFEIFLEIYGELMMLIIPESKWTKKKGAIAIVAALSFIGVMALFLWGVVLLTDNGDVLGWIPIFFAVVLSAVQIGMGIYRFVRTKRE